jgi:hypothetical protein
MTRVKKVSTIAFAPCEAHECQLALDRSKLSFAAGCNVDMNLAGIAFVFADVPALALDDHLLAFAVISCSLL